MSEIWQKHYHHFNNKSTPPAATLQKALEFCEPCKSHPIAIDLGSGNGIDAIALLDHGWQVLAIDQEPEAIELLQNQCSDSYQGQLSTMCSSFEELTELPPSGLINATFSLPFCHPDHFNHVWTLIVNSLDVGGVFTGQFFGPNDSWSNRADMTFLSRAEVEKLLSKFDIEVLKEVNEEGKTASGKLKHWHVYHIVGRKIN